MSDVLLIGGGGYVGSAISYSLLQNGNSVTVYDNFIYGHRASINWALQDKGFRFRHGDLTDEKHRKDFKELLDSHGRVVVLAGLVGDPITKKYPAQSGLVNDLAIKKLIDDSYESETEKHVIFISTCSNYGLMENGELADETSELKPLSLYAEAKVSAETYLLNLPVRKGFTSTVLRFATAFGLSSRMRFDLTVNQFARTLSLGEELVVFDADTWRPYCHVNDFARLIETVFAAKRERVNGQVFNAGGDANNFTKRGLIELLESKIPNSRVSYQEHGGDPRNYRVDFAKVRSVLGFEPHFSVSYGMDQIIDAVENGLFTEWVEGNNLYGNYNLD